MAQALRYLTWVIRAVYVTVICLMLVWIGEHLGGFAAYPLAGFFNYHPFFMSLAFTGFMCEAVLAFKEEPGVKARGAARAKRKIAHMTLHFVALLLVGLGLAAVFLNHHCEKAHKDDDKCAVKADLYTMHSLAGMSTTVLFFLQACGGFYAYWLRRDADAEWKADMMPFHRALGLATFFLGLATMCMGLVEKQWLMMTFGKVAKQTAPINMSNAIGVLVIVLGVLVAVHHAHPAKGADGLEDQPLRA